MRTRVGYTGGAHPNPTYHDLGDHTEALEIDYDPTVLDFDTLVGMFWSAHDPSREAWSTQYRAALWTADEAQHEAALASTRSIEGPVRTAIEPRGRFHRAEDYHQKYRLRRERDVTAALVARYGSDRGMVDSTAAARLNGLLRGFGRRRDLERLLPLLSLPASVEAVVLARVNG